MSDSSDRIEKARQAGRRAAERVRLADQRARLEAEGAEVDQLEPELAARLNEEDRRLAALVADQAVEPVAELEQREGRRATPMSFALRADLKDRLNKFRSEGGTINVSSICNDAIERELERIQTGNALVQRLRVELTERRGPSWTTGYHEGRRWAEDVASWLEITEYSTRYTSRDIRVKVYNEESEEHMFLDFVGRFRAPERDYRRDAAGEAGAPGFQYTSDNGERRWQFKKFEVEAYWRAWLAAIQEVYQNIEPILPSVVDELPPEPPRDVDPDDIPF